MRMFPSTKLHGSVLVSLDAAADAVYERATAEVRSILERPRAGVTNKTNVSHKAI